MTSSDPSTTWLLPAACAATDSPRQGWRSCQSRDCRTWLDSFRAPKQVWTWDITKLKGPARGQYWHLYVIVDIHSRYVTGWALHPYEDGRLVRSYDGPELGSERW